MSTTSNYLSLELSQQLHDAGVVVEAEHCYLKLSETYCPIGQECNVGYFYLDTGDPNDHEVYTTSGPIDAIPAPTATELAQWVNDYRRKQGVGTRASIDQYMYEMSYASPYFAYVNPEKWAEMILKKLIVKEATK